jgi:hypothetical protein
VDQNVEAAAEVLAHLGDINVVPEADHPPLNVQAVVPQIGTQSDAPIEVSQPVIAAREVDPHALPVVASSLASVQAMLRHGNEVIPFLLLSVLCAFLFRGSFHNLYIFENNLDTLVPTFIHDDDVLIFLAPVSMEHNDCGVGSLIGPVLPPTRLPLVPCEDSDDWCCPQLGSPWFPSSRNRRSRLREPLEASFLRRSRRLNLDLGGFRDHFHGLLLSSLMLLFLWLLCPT